MRLFRIDGEIVKNAGCVILWGIDQIDFLG